MRARRSVAAPPPAVRAFRLPARRRRRRSRPAQSPEPRPSAKDSGRRPPRDALDKKSEREFIDGYRAARVLVLDGKYAEGIAAVKALGARRQRRRRQLHGLRRPQLGNFELAKVWYARALATDPNHVRTWQYYGMWQRRAGNMLKAADFLEKSPICGAPVPFKDSRARSKARCLLCRARIAS